jgi:hypothetical protein
MRKFAVLFLLIIPLFCISQTFTFKDIKTNDYLTDYYVQFKLEGKNEFVFCNDRNELTVKMELINNAKEIFLHYSFQKIKIRKEQFNNSVVAVTFDNSLDEIVLNVSTVQKQRKFMGPYLGVKPPVVGRTNENVAINVEKIVGKSITAFLVELKGSSLFVSSGYESKFEIRLYSADNDFKILKELTTETAMYTVDAKKSYILKVDVSDLNLTVPNSKYVIMSVKAISGSLSIKSAKKSKNAEHFGVRSFRDLDKNIVYEPISGYDSLPKIYFEYED